MAQDHWAPRADVIGVALAVGVPEIGTLGALHKAGRAADGFEGPHRRVDSARDDLFGPFEQGQVVVCSGVSVVFH